MMNKIIYIDNEKFDSKTDAAKALGINYTYFCTLSKKYTSFKYKGKSICVSNTEELNNKSIRPHSYRTTGVRCLTTNTVFNSIVEAARFAKADDWTMSLKMEKAGKFIDSEGKEYVRLKPMQQNTTRKYENVKPTVRKRKLTLNIPTPVSTSTPPVVNIIEKTKNLDNVSISSQVLKDKAIALIQDNSLKDAQKVLEVLKILTGK